MMFTKDQLDALKAKLDGSAVKQREQAGRKLSYIEGWHAIAEANRIFGFDAWDRETVELRLVSEKPRKIGRGQYEKDGFGVGYVAKVRVKVRTNSNEIVREGTGYGSGIDADLGAAHESAIKEAETDAMKRALMTFGNPFGLALYDKEQAEVEHSPLPKAEAPPPRPAPRNDAFYKRASYELQREEYGATMQGWEKAYRAAIAGCKNLDELVKLQEDNRTGLARFCDKARPEVVEDLRRLSVEAEDRLKATYGVAA